ncbi:MAG: adenylyltransferase/cytidyltransferase family protein [Bdellovibrionaceae bacterium]|nr:adenylyltransferase/cytidyltransferase family protein [Pseudobdellovibrionaceae bacterium]
MLPLKFRQKISQADQFYSCRWFRYLRGCGRSLSSFRLEPFRALGVLVVMGVFFSFMPVEAAIGYSSLSELIQQYEREGRSLRVGIYIGTFDPPHLGHTQVAKSAIQQGLVDVILWIPNDNAHHKPQATPFYLRYEMSRRLVESEPRIFLPDQTQGPARSGRFVHDSLDQVDRLGRVRWFGLLGTDVLEKALEIYQDQIHWMGRAEQFLVNLREGHVVKFMPEDIHGKKVSSFHSQDGGLSSTAIRNWVKEGQLHQLQLHLSSEVAALVTAYQLWHPQRRSCRLVWLRP